MNERMRTIIAVAAITLIPAMSLIACYGQQYTLVFKNESSDTGDACVYQHDPDMDVQDVMSLAWFAKGAAPTTTLRFRWIIKYCFVWSEMGRLASGVIFKAEQIWEVKHLATENQVTLKMLPEGIYTFDQQMAGPHEGNLHVLGHETLPVRQAMVGIGMAGAPIYVVPAQPSTAWIFTPRPRYWITFGTFEPGEVLDVDSITDKAAEIVVPDGVFSMSAILNRDNTWTVLPTSEANAL